MYKIVYSYLAGLDIVKIKTYIEWHFFDKNSAEQIVDEIKSVIRRLDFSPKRFPLYGCFGDNVRRVTIRKYNVIYLVDDSSETVHILRIVHSGSDITKITIE